ncbi:MAG: F0F1 ATP synthase subunit gamma [Kordiimonas sp.]|nr:F0F1 ATP synthase subunit gamma [Kordiimonas sp.]|tara:strand:- start:1022 stop:1909 length:888 start_codon:yes stop_codon:yes gene_type:complete
MPSLKDLKIRIDSVKSTQKITKAMKMVAAAKLRRAQEAAESARPYAERMDQVLASLGGSMVGQVGAPKLLAGTGADETHLLVVATSERGLCGGFNTNIIKAANRKIRRLLADGKTVKILCVGRKGYQALRREHQSRIVDSIDMSGVKTLGYGDASGIAERLLDMFEAEEFDVCTVFYAKFKSALEQIVTEQQLIPAAIEEEDASASADLGGAVYDYEPDESEILEDLLPRNVGVQIFRALLENAASEQGARMSAMDNATRNAGDMIEKLTLTYNRTRQAVITSELIEIISGAEAL